MSDDIDLIVPAEAAREYALKKLEEFLGDDEYASKHFWDHFGDKRAERPIPLPLFETIEKGVQYDDDHNFDLRMILTLVHEEDRPLFIDCAKFVAERWTRKPAGQLTIRQFRADLCRRLIQLGF